MRHSAFNSCVSNPRLSDNRGNPPAILSCTTAQSTLNKPRHSADGLTGFCRCFTKCVTLIIEKSVVLFRIKFAAFPIPQILGRSFIGSLIAVVAIGAKD